MRSVAVIALFSFVAQAHAEQVAADDELVQQLADKLVDRFQASFLQNADLDTTTLEKPGNLGIPLSDEDQQETMLDWVSGLRGGAKTPMKAMKAAAMKSPMKSMKGLNPYFTKLKAARDSGAKSFEYNGKTYVATKAKTGMVIYKAK